MNTLHTFMQLLLQAAKSLQLCFEYTEFYKRYFSPDTYGQW